MANTVETTNRELVLSRLIDAPREALYRAWTDPEQVKQWFGPHGMTIPYCEMDVRPGGFFKALMRDPEGQEYPVSGVFLELIPNEKIVFTDAYEAGWLPTEKPFMTTILTFEEEGGKTRYTAKALHWTVEDRVTHEEMGFHQGWGETTDRLTELVEKR